MELRHSQRSDSPLFDLSEDRSGSAFQPVSLRDAVFFFRPMEDTTRPMTVTNDMGAWTPLSGLLLVWD